MERKEFSRLSARALEHIDTVLGDLDRDDLDVDLAGDVLTVSFGDGAQFIINAHSAAGQVWMAAGTTAWHFDYEPTSQKWIASRNGDELMEAVSRAVSDKLGAQVVL